MQTNDEKTPYVLKIKPTKYLIHPVMPKKVIAVLLCVVFGGRTENTRKIGKKFSFFQFLQLSSYRFKKNFQKMFRQVICRPGKNFI